MPSTGYPSVIKTWNNRASVSGKQLHRQWLAGLPLLTLMVPDWLGEAFELGKKRPDAAQAFPQHAWPCQVRSVASPSLVTLGWKGSLCSYWRPNLHPPSQTSGTLSLRGAACPVSKWFSERSNGHTSVTIAKLLLTQATPSFWVTRKSWSHPVWPVDFTARGLITNARFGPFSPSGSAEIWWSTGKGGKSGHCLKDGR